ncbi:hypothetical protein [Sporosarcina ureae]|uniref:hypothetical protein n=1 Tax=Sporosarcina ureae TaxID=1571 RepID=UPI000A17E0CE|nr:hypothetical protein [Sporosarcina ureae]ARK22252.1 hypothetical protein SporoP32a_12385 [Sporosarcina ureae]
MKIVFFILLVLPIPLYINDHPFLFWLAVCNAASYLVVGLLIPHIIAKSAMDKFKSTIDMLKQQGATPEEIEKAFQEEIVITEQDRQAVPIWIYYISFSHVLIGAVLSGTGILFLFR